MQKVKSFSGQKVEIRTDLRGIRDPQDRRETQELASELQFLLGQVSDWSVSMGHGIRNWWGVNIVINPNAPSLTREAACALAAGLGDVGLTGMQRQKPEVEEAHKGSTVGTNFAADTILLFIGQHP